MGYPDYKGILITSQMNYCTWFSKPSIRWVLIGGAYALINSAFQVAVTRVISYVSPLHMLSAVSFVLSMGIVCMGGGALFSRRAIYHVRPICVLVALLIPISIFLYFLLADFLSMGPHLVIFFQHPSFIPIMGVALAISAPPFILMGSIFGACFIIVLKEDRRRIPTLIAMSAITFLVGYLGSSLSIQSIGLIGVVIAIAILALLPAISTKKWGIVILIAIGTLFIDHSDHIFRYLKKQPHLWSRSDMPAKHLEGAWSPYARVDFYQKSPHTLAGVYNGTQQWMVTNNSEEDIDVRREGYKFFTGDILIIGSGGGNGVQSLKNARTITAVELDPFVVDTMKHKLGTFNDNVYNKENVTVIAGDGRAFLEKSRQKFDSIILEGASVNVSVNKGTLIGMENYLYTVEGLQAAIDHLTDNGALYVFFAVRESIVKKIIASFPDEIHLKRFEGRTQRPIRYPYHLLVASRSPEQLMPLPSYFAALGLKIEEEPIPSDIRKRAHPVTDNRPFLYITSAGQIRKLGYILAVIGIFIGLLVVSSKKRQLSLFFAVIGAAFVIAELLVVNIARALLGGFLETAATVVGLMSIAYAIGNILSVRMNIRHVTIATVCSFGLLLALLPLGLPTGSLGLKLLWIFAAVFPIGFSMGLFFPKGMAMAAHQDAGWYFAIDTMGSAFGSIVFYIVIVSFGMNSAAAMAFAAYLVSAVLLRQAASSS